MVALHSPDIALVPLAEALGVQKRVRVDGDTVLTARDLGVSIPGAGHLPMETHPGPTRDAVLAHFRRGAPVAGTP